MSHADLAQGPPALSRVFRRGILWLVVVSAAWWTALSPGAATMAPVPLTAAGLGGEETWLPPVAGEVAEHFAAPPAPWASGHRGVDFAAAEAEPIRAPAAGVVSFSGMVVNRTVLSIDHGGGMVSSFEPVDSELEVGEAVAAGDVIATVGEYQTGHFHCHHQRCLHWGVRLHGDYINPLLMLGELEPSVLLPLVPDSP